MSATPAAPHFPAEFTLPPTAAGIRRAAELLTQGKLVILPTETVYGIALSLHSPMARAAARAIKARNTDSGGQPLAQTPWVIHVESAEALLSWVPHVSALGRRLITKSLPGPMAFQIRLDAESEQSAKKRLNHGDSDDVAAETISIVEGESYLTLRCPDFGATLDVIAAVKQPIAIVGAGTPAQPAVFELPDLPAQVLAPVGGRGDDSEIRAALEGGPTRYRRSSTLVRIDGENYAVVRQGVIDERIIHRLADFTILFLCSGNTCRSPMAAALAARAIADKLHISPQELPLRHIVVQSAGLHAARGMRAAAGGDGRGEGLGGDLSGHISQPTTPDLLRRADVIYTMTDAHREEVLELFPGAERKTIRLDPEGDIADPIGSPLPVYERVARSLAAVMKERLSEWPV